MGTASTPSFLAKLAEAPSSRRHGSTSTDLDLVKAVLAPPRLDWLHSSSYLSFASPEADHTSCTAEELSQRLALTPDTLGPQWTEQLSFASPESDFSAPTADE